MSSRPASGYFERWRSVAVPYTALRVGGQASEFLGFLILARRLEPSGFGQLSIAFLVCRYAGLIGDWGALTRGSRDVAASGRHGSPAAFVRHRTLVTVVMTLVAAGGFVATGWSQLVPTVAVILGLGLSRDWVALGREQGPRAATPAAVQGGVLLVASLAATSPASGAIAVGLGYGAAAITSIGLNPVSREGTESRNKAPAPWILLAVLAIQVTSTADTLLLGALRSSAEAGIYAAINRLPNAWIALLTALMFGALPITTRAMAEDPIAYQQLRRRSIRVSAVLGIAVALAAPIVYLLIPVLYGESYLDGQLPAVVLTVSTGVLTFSLPLHVFAVTTGRDRRYFALVGIGAVVNIGLNLLVIPRWGTVGAAAATLAAQALIAVLLWSQTIHPSAPAHDALHPATP